MVKFAELTFQQHPNAPKGKQAKVFFPNGYGASVVQFDGSYGGRDGMFELAVLRGNEADWSLTYDTPITDDVVGYLSPDGVTRELAEIAALPACSTSRLTFPDGASPCAARTSSVFTGEQRMTALQKSDAQTGHTPELLATLEYILPYLRELDRAERHRNRDNPTATLNAQVCINNVRNAIAKATGQ